MQASRNKFWRQIFKNNNVKAVKAVSSQGMQDHFRAKSANWLAGWLARCRNCQPHF